MGDVYNSLWGKKEKKQREKEKSWIKEDNKIIAIDEIRLVRKGIIDKPLVIFYGKSEILEY